MWGYSPHSSAVIMDPHAFGGRKRTHSGDPPDDNCETTKLIGGYWAEVDSHNDNFSTRHLQQRRRLDREVSPSCPAVSVWGHNIQNCPEPYQGLNACSPGRLNGASADCPAVSNLDSSLHNIHRAPAFSPPSRSHPSRKSPASFGNTMFDRRWYQQCMAVRYPANSGSSSSRTLRGSYGISSTASQAASQEMMLNAPDELTYTFASETAGDYLPIRDTQEVRTNHDRLLTQGQDANYPGMWQPQQEIDPPWSDDDASNSHTTAPTQQPRISWPEEVLDDYSGDFLVQQMTSAPPYPSHISSPSTNASWHPGGMVLLTTSLRLPGSSSNYAHESLSGDNLLFQEIQDLSGMQAQDGPESENSQFLPLPYNLQSSSADVPWNTVDMSRSFRSVPEDFTLIDWPPPLNEQLPNDINQTANNYPSFLQPVPHGLHEQSEPRSKEVAPKTSKDRKWEHTVVSGGSFQQLGNQTEGKNSKRNTGRRRGPLHADAARKAWEVRNNRACWRCWLLHLSCSVDKVCDKCQHPSLFRICNKAHLYDYTELFFPQLVAARRHPSAVQQMCDKNVAAFTPNKIQVDLSSGSDSHPMTLTVYEFVPKNKEFLYLYWAPSDINNAAQNPDRIYAPPLGLLNKDESKLRDICRDHIKYLIKNSQYCKDATNGDAVPMSWEIYEAINRYRRPKRVQGNTDLIRKVIKLHAIHFFMSRIIDFTPESAKRVAENLRSPVQSPYGHSVSSKLLTHQIKREMNIIQHELTSEILEELHTELRRREKALWATCFSVIMILSMCIEAVQISVDGFIAGSNSLPASRDDGFEISRELDERPFKDCLDIFHMIYRSGESKSGNGKGEFNPIRDGIEMSKSQDIDVHTAQLVNEIRRIMIDYQDEMEEKARNPSRDNSGDILADHYRFRTENSGRLVAKFLKSFQEIS